MKAIERVPAIERLVEQVRRRRAVDILLRAGNDFARDDGSIYAAAVTYWVLLSVFPTLVLLVAIFGLLAADPDIQQRVIDNITRQLPPGVNLDDQVRHVVEGVSGAPSGIFGLIGLGGALWSASNVFMAVRRALNNAYDVEVKRSFVHGRLRDIVSVFAVIVLLLLSTALTATLGIVRAYLSGWFSGFWANLGWGLVYLLVPLTLSFLVFLLLYRLIPNHTLRWGDLWVGALIAAFGFELAKAAFGIYLAQFASFNEVYGTLGGIVAFLVFVYLVSNVMIFAAEINSEIAKDRA